MAGQGKKPVEKVVEPVKVATPEPDLAATVAELQKQLAEMQMVAKQNAEAGESVPMSYQPTPAATDDEVSEEYMQQFTNQLDLPKALRAEISEKNYVCRFININEFNKRGKIHTSMWRPYRPDIATEMDQGYGRDADGYIRRGDLVLAVRSKSEDRAAKSMLAKKNIQYAKHDKDKAHELRKFMSKNGISAKILDTYDDKK